MSFLSKIFKKFKFITKGIVALNVLLVSATYGVLCSIFFTILGKRDLAQWSTARFYYHLFSFIMGMKINVDKPELLEKLPAILVSNHQSELDIYMLGRIFPPKCVVTAKKQLKYLPFLGWFMSASGTFFLDRSNKKSAIDTLNEALNQLKLNKGGLFMFPEGTRSYSSKPVLLPFKKGAFHLAVQAQIPIIPLVVSNTSNLYSIKLFNFNRGEINIKVLDPISTEGLTKDDVPKLTEEIYTKMNKAVSELGMSKLRGDKTISSEENNEDDEERVESDENIPTIGTDVSETTSLLK
jgi:lysophosphatidate acyltransferase